jgi:hypothetical protein
MRCHPGADHRAQPPPAKSRAIVANRDDRHILGYSGTSPSTVSDPGTTPDATCACGRV